MHHFYEQIDSAGVLHVASVATVAGAIVGWLPPLATALACVYYAVKIYESDATQRLIAWIRSKLSS